MWQLGWPWGYGKRWVSFRCHVHVALRWSLQLHPTKAIATGCPHVVSPLLCALHVLVAFRQQGMVVPVPGLVPQGPILCHPLTLPPCPAVLHHRGERPALPQLGPGQQGHRLPAGLRGCQAGPGHPPAPPQVTAVA